jgi:hypothetical protein
VQMSDATVDQIITKKRGRRSSRLNVHLKNSNSKCLSDMNKRKVDRGQAEDLRRRKAHPVHFSPNLITSILMQPGLPEELALSTGARLVKERKK